MPKKVLVALPAGLLEQIDFIAQVEHRNRSDLIRESLRRYINEFNKNPTSTSIVERNGTKIMELSKTGPIVNAQPNNANAEQKSPTNPSSKHGPVHTSRFEELLAAFAGSSDSKIDDSDSESDEGDDDE